jgi:hypothetical protein
MKSQTKELCSRRRTKIVWRKIGEVKERLIEMMFLVLFFSCASASNNVRGGGPVVELLSICVIKTGMEHQHPWKSELF